MGSPERSSAPPARQTIDGSIGSINASLSMPSFAKSQSDLAGTCGNGACSQPGLLWCSQCDTKAYCSAECQLSNWKAHKLECQYLGRKKKAAAEEKDGSFASCITVAAPGALTNSAPAYVAVPKPRVASYMAVPQPMYERQVSPAMARPLGGSLTVARPQVMGGSLTTPVAGSVNVAAAGVRVPVATSAVSVAGGGVNVAAAVAGGSDNVVAAPDGPPVVFASARENPSVSLQKPVALPLAASLPPQTLLSAALGMVTAPGMRSQPAVPSNGTLVQRPVIGNCSPMVRSRAAAPPQVPYSGLCSQMVPMMMSPQQLHGGMHSPMNVQRPVFPNGRSQTLLERRSQTPMERRSAPQVKNNWIKAPVASNQQAPIGRPADVCGNNCCKEVGSLVCSQCENVKYCSAACQQDHWQVHQVDCARLAAMNKAIAFS